MLTTSFIDYVYDRLLTDVFTSCKLLKTRWIKTLTLSGRVKGGRADGEDRRYLGHAHLESVDGKTSKRRNDRIYLPPDAQTKAQRGGMTRRAYRERLRAGGLYDRAVIAASNGLNQIPGLCRSFEAGRPKPNQITTSGSLGQPMQAFVYVGVRGSRVKVGMTRQPETRCKQLGATLVYSQPVVPEAAKLVETTALVRLGVRKRGSEWVYDAVEDVINAVKYAYATVGRAQHVDPTVTPDQARTLRASVA